MTDEPESLGEISRNLRRVENSINRSLENISTNFVLASVWAVEKRSLDERIGTLGREIGGLRANQQTQEAEKELEHKELNNKITLLKEELHKRDDDVRKERAARWFAIGLASLGLIFGIISAVVAASLNAAINGGP